MRLLVYGINFAPELTGIGKYSSEMAAWLAEAGHDVRVVTAPPYYPEWKVGAGYSGVAYRREIASAALQPRNDGEGIASAAALPRNDSSLVVYRCPLWVPVRPSGLKRLVHLASFAVSSLPVMLRQVFWRPDVVWVVAPAFFCAPGALLTARLAGAPAWLHIQDFEVDAAFDLGLLKGQRVKRMVLALERWVLRRFNVVSTISGRMQERLLSKGVAPARALMFPNWVDISAVHPSQAGGTYREELGFAPCDVVALYSGNMGNKQGLEILADAARLLVSVPKLRFVFCGNGAGRAELEARSAGLPNVTFMDLQPLERLGDLLTMADIHLLPQRADAADLVMPSKLTGMLASGRPVVVTAHEGTEVARVVQGCGTVVPPEQAEAFASAIATLADQPQRRAEQGVAARRYAEEHLNKDAVLARFEADLLRLTQAT